MKISLYYLAGILICSSCSPSGTESPFLEKPNIVFIFTDDQTYTAVHALGNNEIYTPNLDRLADSGTTFTHAFNMGAWNGAVCLASRAMLLSGRFLWKANDFRQNWLKGDSLDLTWSKIMKKNGYDTYMTGKWHVDAPAEKVFGNVKHIRPGMPQDSWGTANVRQKLNQKIDGEPIDPYNVMPIGYARPRDENDWEWNPWDKRFGGFWQGGKHWSEILKDDALAFFDQAAETNNPFFMYLAFNAPHDPRQSPKSFIERYPLDEISLPPNWQPDHLYRDSIGNGWDLRDEALAPIPRTEYATKVHLQEYYAIITHLDKQIGEIMDALELTGKMENTYIFFTSDHGLAIGSHGLFGKQNMYDHSIRVPLIVAGPGIPGGKKVDAEVYLQDIMPASLELAGSEKPEYVDFHSLYDLAVGTTKKSHYNAIYGGYINWQRMIRKDGFKLIVYPRAQVLLLFDLVNDPYELENLAEKPEYKDKVKSLFQNLLLMQKQMGDTLHLEPVFEGILADQPES